MLRIHGVIVIERQMQQWIEVGVEIGADDIHTRAAPGNLLCKGPTVNDSDLQVYVHLAYACSFHQVNS